MIRVIRTKPESGVIMPKRSQHEYDQEQLAHYDRMMKRVKALPKTPRRNKEESQSLAEELASRHREREEERKKHE
jgi:hypothetical protein